MHSAFVNFAMRSSRSHNSLDQAARTSRDTHHRTPSPTNARAGSNTTAHVPRQTYPEALPSTLSAKYDGPVMGTAVIDSDHTAISVLLEMVTPDATPLLDPLTQEYLEDCREEMDARCRCAIARGDGSYDSDGSLEPSHRSHSEDDDDRSTGDQSENNSERRHRRQRILAEQQRRQSQLTSIGCGSVEGTDGEGAPDGSFTTRCFPFSQRHGRCSANLGHDAGQSGSPNAFAAANAASSTPGRNSRPSHRFLREGGYIVFTDAYLQTHPSDPVVSITQEFQLVNPLLEPPTPVNPALDENKRKTEEIKRIIKEAEQQHRPLFRRRPAEVVYGEARYIPRTGVENAEPALEEDTEVHLVRSFAL